MPLGNLERGFVRTVVDDEQHLARLHELAGLEADFGKIAVGPGHDVDALDGHHFAGVFLVVDYLAFERDGDRNIQRRQFRGLGPGRRPAAGHCDNGREQQGRPVTAEMHVETPRRYNKTMEQANRFAPRRPGIDSR